MSNRTLYRRCAAIALSVSLVSSPLAWSQALSVDAPAGAPNEPRQDAAKLDAAKPNAQMQAVLDALAGLNPKPIDALSPAEARRQPTPAMAAAKVAKQKGVDMTPAKVKDVDDRKIRGPAGDIPIRVYTPANAPDGPLPTIVYYHGGGFVIATIDTYDASCRALANMTGAVVVSVEYRKAPENKYPAAVDDSFAAYKWVRENTREIGGDPSRVAVAGESAGGNLATVVCMKAKEENVALPAFQLLVYPVTNDDMNTVSYEQHADAKPLNKPMMAWFFGHYLSDPSSAGDPHVNPLKASIEQLTGLPPALIITAEIDPLRSDGETYARKLQSAGVRVEQKNYEGVTHEFFGMGLVVDAARQAEQDAADALKAAFAPPTAGGQDDR